MGWMFGLMCNDEDLLECAVSEVKDALLAGQGEKHDGLGIGYYRNEEPLLKKRPKAKNDSIDYRDLVEGISSNVLLVHVRKASNDPWKDTNSQPFRMRKWLFTHVGHLPALLEKRNDILAGLPPFLARNVQGETDSELAFHLFLNHLYQSGMLNDLGAADEQVVTQLQKTAEEIEQIHGGAKRPFNYSLVVTNGQVMAAACRRVAMHYSHREGIQECPRHDDSEQQRRLHRRFKGIMLGAGMSDPGHQWREVADGSLLSVSRGLELRVAQI